MNRYQFTNKAVEDLSNVWNFTFDTWSKTQADKYYSDLVDKCVEMAGKPFLGRNYSNITETVKGVKINRHIIFYRTINDDLIQIERILHERMDTCWRVAEQ
ncbi:MAG: type II toxin-antitoxin system RelE/ParE family toxin [Bacteroidota bacterium]